MAIMSFSHLFSRPAWLLTLIYLALPISAQWINNQAAINVLGQPDFGTNTPGTTATIMNGPTSVAVDPVSHKVFVADGQNNRVLRYSSLAALSNGNAAEGVLGQNGFSSGSFPSLPTASSMSQPAGIFVDGAGRLWVADGGNNRVLRFDDAASKADGAAADGVLGQAGFATKTFLNPPTGSSLTGPVGVFVDSSGRLWVGDSLNNRVLRFDNAATKANGAPADGVLGAANFTSNGAVTPPAASSLLFPNGVFVDGGGRLWVADSGNNRVLRFDNAATKANGAAADGVLGQPDFMTDSSATSQSGMLIPVGVYGDPSGRLYVADVFNNRVLIFNNAAQKNDGANANNVLGQSNFTSDNGGLSATSLEQPGLLCFDFLTSSLFVPDLGNNRVVRHAVSPPLTVQAGGRGNNLGGNIADPAICIDSGGLVGIEVSITNSDLTPAATTFMATLPNGMTAIAGTCVADTGNACTVAANGSTVSWNGALNGKQSVTLTYRARIAPTNDGVTLCLDNTATLGMVTYNLPYCFTINCPLVNTRQSNQKAGSVLVFPYYTSTIGGISDTRLTISNVSHDTSPNAAQSYVHLFLVDGATCQQSDLYLCLTPNASFSFKASEYDPGNTGYLIAVAVNKQGFPINNNVLTGNAFVRTATLGGNYSAEVFRANGRDAALYTTNINTVTLYFDHLGYDAVPKQFVVAIQSPQDVTGQQVVTAGLSGDLTAGQVTGAAQVGIGVAFNERAVSGSFVNWLTGTCHTRATVTSTSPRVPNGLSEFIKSGRIGSFKFTVGGAVGLLLTPRTSRWTGIRSLHAMQTTATTLTIPIAVPGC